jgi:hypothetical protein
MKAHLLFKPEAALRVRCPRKTGKWVSLSCYNRSGLCL